MKLKFTSHLLLLLSILMTTAISSCSDDDDQPELNGAQQVARIEAARTSYKPISFEDDLQTYYIVADDSTQAEAICENIIGTEWNGKTATITLNDDFGTILVQPGAEDGIYVQITCSFLLGSDNFDILIVTQAYLDSMNRRDKWPYHAISK